MIEQHRITWQFLRMGITDAVFTIDGTDKLIDERMKLFCVVSYLPFKMLQDLLIRRIKFHSSRKSRQVMDPRLHYILYSHIQHHLKVETWYRWRDKQEPVHETWSYGHKKDKFCDKRPEVRQPGTQAPEGREWFFQRSEHRYGHCTKSCCFVFLSFFLCISFFSSLIFFNSVLTTSSE